MKSLSTSDLGAAGGVWDRMHVAGEKNGVLLINGDHKYRTEMGCGPNPLGLFTLASCD
jgi:hypothetical protein